MGINWKFSVGELVTVPATYGFDAEFTILKRDNIDNKYKYYFLEGSVAWFHEDNLVLCGVRPFESLELSKELFEI